MVFWDENQEVGSWNKKLEAVATGRTVPHFFLFLFWRENMCGDILESEKNSNELFFFWFSKKIGLEFFVTQIFLFQIWMNYCDVTTKNKYNCDDKYL